MICLGLMEKRWPGSSGVLLGKMVWPYADN